MGPRIAAAVAIVVVLAAGIYLSGKLGRDSRDRVGQLQSERTDADAVRDDVAARKEAERFESEAFTTFLKEDAKALELAEFDPAAIAAAQPHAVLVDEAVEVGPGRAWTSGRLRVVVTIEKVNYQKQGAVIAAKHTIAVVTNVSKKPLAYYARLRSKERGLCDVRGARMHNAMALMPRESAEIVVCAGVGRVRIERLEALEISALGYHYLSRVPPRAVLYDGITAAAHSPLKRSKSCGGVDIKEITGLLRQGLTRWVDVADFYSRHSCERFRFFAEYRHEEGHRELPVRPPS